MDWKRRQFTGGPARGYILTTEPWVTLQQVAEHLQVSEDTIHRWMQLKGMPAHRAGRYWRFKLSQVDAWIESGDAAEQKSSDAGGKGAE